MKLINNDYKVIETYVKKKREESYLVERQGEPGKLYFLKILEPHKHSSCISDFIHNFPRYSDIKHRYLLDSYDFELIKSLNLKPITGRLYYVLSDFNGWPSLDSQFQTMSSIDLAKMTARLMELLSYLHFRGFIYTIISPEKIYVSNDGEVKLLNISTSIEYLHEGDRLNSIKEFIAPEVLDRSGSIGYKADYYSIGIIMNKYLLPALISENNPRVTEVESMIKELTWKSPENRTANLLSCKSNLEKLFDFNLDTDFKIEREELHINTAVSIGHEDQLKELEEVEELIKSNSCIYSCAIIEGNIGSGKTSLLEIFLKRTSLRGNHTAIVGITGGKIIGTDSFKSFLLEFMVAAGIEYGFNSTSEAVLVDNDGGKEEYSLDLPSSLYRLYDLIAESLLRRARVESAFIGINNIEYADPQMLGMLDLLLTKFRGSRVFIIATLNQGRLESKSFEAQLQEWISKNNILRITSSNLSLEATGRFVKEVLGISFIPRNFSQILYKESLGNIRYLIYLLRHLFDTIELYIGTDGQWKIRKDRYDDLEFPKSFMATLRPRIDSLEIPQVEILTILSCFEGPARKSIVEKLSTLKFNDLEILLNSLVKNKLITIEASEFGESIDIAEGEIKKILYQDLDPFEKRKIHNKITTEIIKIKNKEEEYSFDELFFQLDSAERRDELLDLVYDRIDRERNKFSDSSILILTKAYESFSAASDTRDLEILDKVTYSFIMRGDTEPLKMYLDLMEEISSDRGEKMYFIRSMLYRLELMVRGNELIKSKELIVELEKLLDSNDFYDEKVYLTLLRAKHLLDADDHIGTEKSADEGISLSEEYDISRYIGDLYNIRGISKYMGGDPEAALEDYEKALEGYKLSDRPFDMVKPINNIGSIQSEYYGLEKLALDYYYKCVEISESYGLVSLQTTFLNNIGEAYTNIREYDNAERYLGQAIELSNRINDRKHLFMSHVLKGTVDLKKGRLSRAFETYEKLKAMNSSGPILDREVLIQYTNFLGQLYLEIGNFKFSREFSKITMERSFDISKKEYMKAKTRIMNLDYLEEHLYDEKSVLDLAEEYRNQGSLYDRAYFLLLYSLMAFYLKRQDLSNKLLEEYKTIDNKEVVEKFDKDLHLIMLIVEGTTESLSEAVDFFGKHINEIIISTNHINIVLGHRLLEIRKNFESVRILMANLDKYETAARLLGMEKFGDQYKIFYMKDAVVALIDKGLKEITGTERNFEPTIENYINSMTEDLYHNIFASKKSSECCLTLEELLSKLDGNADENLNKILEYLTVKTNAECGYIKIYESDGGEGSIYRHNCSDDYKLNLIIENSIKEGEAVLIKRDMVSQTCHILDSHIEEDLAGFIAVPIFIGQGAIDSLVDRRQSISRKKVYGHVLLITKSNINRFDEERVKLVRDLNGIVYLNSENERLFRNSYYDKLTGALRRSVVERSLEDAIQHYSVNERGFACMMLDIDKFKLVNDNFGHQTGDRVLSHVGEAIRRTIRKTDTAGRYGGEEFLMIIEDVDSEAAFDVAEKIRSAIETMEISGIGQKVTASIGIALYPEDGQLPEDLILRADQSMYYAKEVLGRNSVAAWNDDMDSTISNSKLDHDLLVGGFENDSDRIGALTDAALLLSKKLPLERKTSEFLGLLLYSTLGQIAEIYTCEKGNYVKLAGRTKSSLATNTNIPLELFKRVEKSGISENYIDWKSEQDTDGNEKTREYRSGAVCPIILEGIVKGIIFIEAPLQSREYKQKDLKYIEVMGSVFSANLV